MKTISKNNNVREISARNSENSYLIPHYDLHLMPNWAAIKPDKGRHRFAIHTGKKDGESNRWDFKTNPQQKYPFKINLREVHMVNGVAKDIFKIINGAMTSNEVYNNLLQHHNQAYGTKKEEVYNFLKDCVQKDILSEVAAPAPISIHRTGSEESTYPVHTSIEVTSACNLRCLHCYGEFDEAREDAIDADKVISLLAELAENGCCTVELTGGECTIHPEFERILSFCCSHMDLVGILTNGVAIRDKTAEIIMDNADKCTVQICINGNEEYHNKFTRSKIAYRRAISSVEKLASGGVFISTPMNMTLDNYMMIEETCERVMSMGSARFQAAWVQTEFGRARELYADMEEVEECKHVIYGLTCKERFEILKKASDTMFRLHEKYPLFAHIEPAKDMLKITDYTGACGAGSRRKDRQQFFGKAAGNRMLFG